MEIFTNIINKLFIFLYLFLILIIIFKLIIKRNSVNYFLLFLLIFYILPILGIIYYILFGEIKLGIIINNRIKYFFILTYSLIKNYKIKYNFKNINQIKKTYIYMFKLCKNIKGINSFKFNKLNLITNSKNILKSLIIDINMAKKKIEMIFYIWHTGGLVNKVSEALIFAAKRGVKCRLIVDYVGSLSFLKSYYFLKMKLSGIYIIKALNINIFNFFLKRCDIRQHKKIVLIDNYISYTGSMNMIDPKFFKKKYKFGELFDIMVRMEGIISKAISIVFSLDWKIETNENILSKNLNFSILPFNYSSFNTIQLIASYPDFSQNAIHKTLLTYIYSAKKYLFITTPYFIPTNDLINAICTVSQRGVDVRITLPYKNDSIIVKWTSNYYYDELLKSGVTIYQFHCGFIHTKSIVIDKKISFIGTLNLDIRSLLLNFEITLLIKDTNFVNNLNKIQKYYFSKSNIIEYNIWYKRPYWKKIIETIFYFLSPIL
ncbi:MAG: cardiolipin synthase [Candidatus Makana argininalis]